MKRPIFSPSLMCMDMLHVGKQLEVLNRNFDWLHFDIMDGHYCKNLALTPALLKAVRSRSSLPIDVHIMATKPEEFMIDEVIKNGASSISLHPDTFASSSFRTINKIKDAGCRAGLVLNPLTTLESVDYLLGRIDVLTIMTIDIGFAGQKFIWEMLEKIRKACELREKNGYHYLIQIDGGCKKDYYKALYDAGADAFIVGNAGLFSLDNDLQKACDKMHEQFRNAVGGGDIFA
ncbi:MAG: D-allulose 6-phosphate 3-epimerase [Eubacteriales bacterium]|nr:D-allulose 6-phosphate 3-epimerase [Eubacteriales bacterium]